MLKNQLSFKQALGPLLTGALFLLFILTTTPLEASLIAPRCSQILNEQLQSKIQKMYQIQNFLINLDIRKEPRRFDHLIDKEIQATIDFLDYQGIRWRYHETTKRILIIEPDFKAAWHNQLAANLAQDLKGLRLEIDPRELRKSEEIFYEETKNRIVVSPYILTHNMLIPELNHEIQHAKDQILFYDGKLEEWAGNISFNSNKKRMHPIYTDGFSFDEMVTYGLEMFQMSRLLLRQEYPDEDSYRSLSSIAKTATVLSRWLSQVTLRSQKIVQDLIENPLPWNNKYSTIEYMGQRFPLKIYRSKRDKDVYIELYEINEKNLEGIKQKVTNMVIHHGKFSTELNFAQARNLRGDEDWILLGLQRLETIQSKAENLNAMWKDLATATEKQDRKLIHHLSDQIYRHSLSDITGEDF